MSRRLDAFALAGVVGFAAAGSALADPDQPPFRIAAAALIDCLDREALSSATRQDPPLAYAARVRVACAGEADAILAYGRTPAERRRLRGALRAASSDAVLVYDARTTFSHHTGHVP